MGKTTFDKNLDTGELTISRIVNAPVEKVWEAFTTAEVFEKWWGPRGWRTRVKELSMKPGGQLLYGMKCVDEAQGEWYGKESWGKMVFEEINPPNEFSYTDYFCDENGDVDENMPSTKANVKFEAVENGTKIINTNVYKSGEDLKKVVDMGMEQGVEETWDRLEELFAK